MIRTRAYNQPMAHPIIVDNSRPATVRDTARILGVSKKRTNQLIELVRRMIHKDARTGEFVIRTSKDTSRNGSTKASKTNSLIEEARRAGKHKTKKEAGYVASVARLWAEGEG